MIFREYNVERDCAAVHRIWREIGWLEQGSEQKLDRFLEVGRTIVGEVRGEAECIALTTPGTIRYLEESLPFCCVASVTTSHVARKQGLARQLTAQAIATAASEGALVAGLTMFEQGFYDQLGFGTGAYEHAIAFDPAQLNVPPAARPPYRFNLSESQQLHAARLQRRPWHGACNLYSPMVTQSDMEWRGNRSGLGYRDGPNGEISHYFLLDTGQSVHGPYTVRWTCYQTGEQLLELLGALRNLGDQVHLVWMPEPPGMQMQDFLRQPKKGRRLTKGSAFEQQIDAGVSLQVRICDLAGCLARTHLPCESVRFDLRLSDPIEASLDDASAWRGIAGDYIVTLGPESSCTTGSDPTLPLMEASVGAFSRMWLGVCPATALAISDTLRAPETLLRRLDRALRLPIPVPDWDF